MLKSTAMVALFYFINFFCWDMLVNHHVMPRDWASFTVYTLLFVLALLLFRKELKDQWKRLKRDMKSPGAFILELFLWSLGGAALSGLFIFVFGNLLQINLMPANQENVNDMVSVLPGVLSLLMMSVYAPVIEEVTFRHSLIGWVKKDNKALLILMTVISVVTFDLIHVIHRPEFLYYLPMSLLLAARYWRYDRNVWSSILFHVFFNTAGFLLILLGIIQN